MTNTLASFETIRDGRHQSSATKASSAASWSSFAKAIALLTFGLTLGVASAPAQQTVTSKHGGTASGTVIEKGNTATATGSATSANGTTVSGTATVKKTKTGTSDSASVTGPQGGTSTATGTTTNNGTSTTVSGTVTGAQGKSKSGTVTVPKSQ